MSASQPTRQRVDPSTGQVRTFTYAAPSVAANRARRQLGMQPATPAPAAVWLSHIAAMATDSQGHLYYIRAGWDQIEEVSA